MRVTQVITHEDYIRSVKDVVQTHCTDPEQCERLGKIKLVYGTGYGRDVRGTTIYNRWQHKVNGNADIVEICALGEENFVQLAGTTLHELAHVLAGMKAGHDKAWKDVCLSLGLRKAAAAGMTYLPVSFEPWFRAQWVNLPKPNDGAPAKTIDGIAGLPIMRTLRGCTLGYGTRGGKSRGTGSGSRLRKYVCSCGVIARVASNDFKAHCDTCGQAFKREAKDILYTAITGKAR